MSDSFTLGWKDPHNELAPPSSKKIPSKDAFDFAAGVGNTSDGVNREGFNPRNLDPNFFAKFEEQKVTNAAGDVARQVYPRHMVDDTES